MPHGTRTLSEVLAPAVRDRKVKAIAESERAYHMLEEIGVQPNISYLVKVRHREEEIVLAQAARGGLVYVVEGSWSCSTFVIAAVRVVFPWSM